MHFKSAFLEITYSYDSEEWDLCHSPAVYIYLCQLLQDLWTIPYAQFISGIHTDSSNSSCVFVLNSDLCQSKITQNKGLKNNQMCKKEKKKSKLIDISEFLEVWWGRSVFLSLLIPVVIRFQFTFPQWLQFWGQPFACLENAYDLTQTWPSCEFPEHLRNHMHFKFMFAHTVTQIPRYIKKENINVFSKFQMYLKWKCFLVIYH